MFEIERTAPARLRYWDALLDEMETLAFCRVTLNIVILLASSKRVLFALMAQWKSGRGRRGCGYPREAIIRW